MTSQGMAAWTVQRMGSPEQRAAYLSRLAGGQLAAVAFSEPGAGSDLSAMQTRIRRGARRSRHRRPEGLDDRAPPATPISSSWPGGFEDGTGAAVMVPTDAPGVTIRPVAGPSGCRAAGHADVHLDLVRLPCSDALLGGGGQPLSLLCTTALAYGRMSVAWGCVGILRGCLAAAVEHASHAGSSSSASRSPSTSSWPGTWPGSTARSRRRPGPANTPAGAGPPAPRTWLCPRCSQSTSAPAPRRAAPPPRPRSPARPGPWTATWWTARTGTQKLMEIIEGTSNEISQLMLAKHVVATRCVEQAFA